MGILLTSTSNSWGFTIILWGAIMVGFYFLLVNPQRKEKKRVDAMLAEMEVGDTVVTTSGFYGVLIDISGEDVIVEFGSNRNCRIPMQKSAIAMVEKAGSSESAAPEKSAKTEKAAKTEKTDKKQK